MKSPTKHYKNMAYITGTLSLLCNIAPAIYFIVKGIYIAPPAKSISIGFIALAAIILSIVNILMKVPPRSLFWIILLGLYWILGDIVPVLVTMFATCFLDEFILTPLYKYSKNKYTINKEIDRRG